jgi:hypothetical protein
MRAGGADCAVYAAQTTLPSQTAILRMGYLTGSVPGHPATAMSRASPGKNFTKRRSMTGQLKDFAPTPTEELSRYEKNVSHFLSVSFTIP